MTGKAMVAATLLAAGLAAQPVIYRADVKPDRAVDQYQTHLTLRYGPSLDVSQTPEVFVGSPLSGFAAVAPARIRVALATVTVQLTVAETEAIDKRAAASQKSFLYIPRLVSGGGALTDQLLEIPAGKPKLTLDSVRGKFLQVQQNYLPPKYAACEADRTCWTVKDQFGHEYKIARLTSPSAIGERHMTFVLEQAPRSSATLRLAVSLKPGAATPEELLGDIKTAAAPQGTPDDPPGKADIYASLLFVSSGGGDPVYGTDLRLKGNILRRDLAGGYLGVTPAFTLKANSNKADDENALTSAVNLEWLRPLDNPVVIRSVYLVAAPTLEAKKNFENKNVVLDLTGTLLSKTLGTRRFMAWPRVLGGIELGRNIDNVRPELEGNRITRWKAGGEFKTRLDINRSWLKDIRLGVSFMHRFLLEPELFTKTATTKLPAGTLTSPSGATIQVPSGTLSSLSIFGVSKGTRNYLEAKLSAGVTPNIEIFTSYTLGSLPPLFEKVDKVQVGLAYRYSAPFH